MLGGADTRIRVFIGLQVDKDNYICNSLSRRGTTPDMTVEEHALSMGINGRVLDVGENSALGNIIKSCDL